MVDEWNVWSTGGWIQTRVNWSTWRETCPSVILTTTNLLRTILGLNPGFYSRWMVTAEALLARNGNVRVNNFGCVTTGSINERSETSYILSAVMSSNSSSACLMYQQKSIMYTYNNKHLNIDAMDIYLHLHGYRYCECRLVLYHVSLHTHQKQCAVKYEYYHKIQGLRLALYIPKTQQNASGG